MSESFELVLALEASAASEWMQVPVATEPLGGRAAPGTAKKARRGGRAARVAVSGQGDVGAAVADALSRMPDVALLHPMQDSTVRAFVDADGTRRAMLAVAADGTPRVMAVRTRAFVPGVWRCETVCDESPGKGGAAAMTEGLSATLEKALGKVEKLVGSPVLAVRRGVWRWTGSADGVVVDIELHDVRGASTSESAGGEGAASVERARSNADGPEGASASPGSEASPVAFCEMRLVSRIEAGRTSDGDAASTSIATAGHVVGDRTTSEGAKGDLDDTAGAVANANMIVSADPIVSALEALFAAAGVLADVFPVFPTLTDGYARACARDQSDAAVRASRIDLSHARNPHDALIEACASIALQWFGNEAGVRSGAGPEFVHQMRVALRRLKTLLKTFPRWIDDSWARTIAPDLDWLGSLLGQVRDLDVFVDATLPALAEADADGGAWAGLQAKAAARRDEARAQVAAALRTRRYALLALAWLRWLAMQRVSTGPLAMVDKALEDYARKRVKKHFTRLHAKPALTSLTPAERHRRRIEAKRLRYTLEFFESLASRKTRRKVAKQLGRIQSVLGDGSDAATALRFLESLDVTPYEHGFARGWCEAVNRWSAVEGERLLQELGKPRILGVG